MIYANLAGIELQFETAPSLFSPTKVDRGSLAMLSRINFEPNDKVLDLGCGYGLIGVYAAKVIGAGRVWMADNDQTAIECAVKNRAINGVEGVAVTVSDGYRDIRETNFTKIICNPPYHVDFSVPKHFIEKGFNRLVSGRQDVHRHKAQDMVPKQVTQHIRWCSGSGNRFVLVFEAVKKSFTYARNSDASLRTERPS
jgi:16S rRNA (guanine1207-N2)-methyltransferase